MVEESHIVCDVHIKNVSTFLQYVESTKAHEVADGNKADFLFRGQRSDEYLIPKLGRWKWNHDLAHMERLIMAEFASQIPPYAKAGYDDKWDRLALAQHHGLPTRLLDWTYSAIIALWFVVRKEPKTDRLTNQKRDGVVWILKTRKEDFIDFDDCCVKRNGPFNQDKTCIFRPRVVSQRIVAQTGVFTLHHDLEEENKRFLPLETNSLFKNRLVKCLIRAEDFKNLREGLDYCGVNASTVFPDLDGLCEHLEWRYTKDIDKSPLKCDLPM